MAIVNCRGCGKRISDMAACPHCGTENAAGERTGRRPPATGIPAYFYFLLATLAAVAGAGWYYAALARGADTVWPRYLIGIAVAVYVGARVAVGVARWRGRKP